MRSLADLLKNHPVPGIRISDTRRIIAGAAGALLSHPVNIKHVRYDEGKLFFTIPSILKTELLLREADLKKTLLGLGVSVSEVR